MVSICVEIRAYWELPETERTRAKNVRRGVRTWAGVSFWVWDFQRPGRGCYARSIHCTGDCKALREKEGGRAMGTHFSQTHPVLQKHSRPYLAPLGAVTHNFLLWTHSKQKGKRIFQWTELCQLMVYNFFTRIFCFTEFLTDSNKKAIAAN